MKILYLTQLYPPMLYGGGEYIFSKWAQEMANRGHTICVITQKVKGTKDFEVLNGVNVYRILPEIKYRGSLYSIGLAHNLGFLLSSSLLSSKHPEFNQRNCRGVHSTVHTVLMMTRRPGATRTANRVSAQEQDFA